MVRRRESVTATEASELPPISAPRGARNRFWILLPVAATVAAASAVTDRSLPVMAPLVATVWIASVFYASLRNGSRGAVVEIGSVYMAAVTLYACFPLIAYLALGLEYTINNDNRLYIYQPTPVQVGRIGWFYVLHLAFFSLGYRLTRGHRSYRVQPRPPGAFRAKTIGLLLALVFAYFWLLGEFFNLQVSDYSHSYLLYSRLPLLVVQVTNHLGGIRFVLEVAILAVAFSDYRRYRWFIVGGLGAIAAITFLKLGSRTEFVLLSFGALMMYHWLVRPITERALLAAGAAIVALFLVAGMLRGRQLESQYSVGWNVFAYANEFESLFANAYDLDQRRAEGLTPPSPVSFYLVDVLAAVPQQISPFTKISPADWYVNEFYPYHAEKGVGFAFGTISESILGGGLPDLALRSALLGVALALAHRWAARKTDSFWAFVIYAWLTLDVYNSLRNTTFCLASLFLYRVVPVVVTVEALRALIGRQRQRSAHGPAEIGASVSQ